MKPIPYGRQQITQDDIEAVIEVLRSDFLTQGPEVDKFEDTFAQYVGARYAVAVANGTAALHLSALALGVQSGDKVITTPLTFVASANCVRYCGGDVVFADIDPNTYLLDIHKVRGLLENAPKGSYVGIIPVDFAGYPVNVEEYRQLADEFGLWLLEDACHAPGAWFTDTSGIRQYSGNAQFSNLTVFSFHPVKHIACGEGGMITTNSEEFYRKLISLRTHGITKESGMLRENHGPWYYEMQELGYNYRLTDFQAALGRSQLVRAEKGLSRRQEIAKRYNGAFSSMSQIKTPSTQENINHAWHLYVIQTDNRSDLYNHLRNSNVFAQIHYIPVHLQPYYRQLGWRNGDLPIAEAYYGRCLSLPMYPTLSMEEQMYLIDLIIDFYRIK